MRRKRSNKMKHTHTSVQGKVREDAEQILDKFLARFADKTDDDVHAGVKNALPETVIWNSSCKEEVKVHTSADHNLQSHSNTGLKIVTHSKVILKTHVQDDTELIEQVTEDTSVSIGETDIARSQKGREEKLSKKLPKGRQAAPYRRSTLQSFTSTAYSSRHSPAETSSEPESKRPRLSSSPHTRDQQFSAQTDRQNDADDTESDRDLDQSDGIDTTLKTEGSDRGESKDDVIEEIVQRLGKIGDDLTRSRHVKLASLPPGPLSYSGFAQMVDLQTVSSWSQVARVFHIAAHLNQSLGTEEMTETIKHLALRYIRENCETWVAQKGGFGAVLSGKEV